MKIADSRKRTLSLVAAVLILSCIVRIRLADAPLERDEGEHGYAAQMMLAGNAPWQAAYNMKLPGTDAFYALWLALFGQTAVAIRMGLLLVNVATIILITALGARLFGNAGGAAAGASYGILSLSQGVLGTIAHSTHYVVFFAVLGTLLLVQSRQRPWPVFAGGVAYGLAFLMKQPGILFAIFGALYLAWQCRRSGTVILRLGLFLAGVVLPYGLLCLYLWQAGVFARFWFWTVTLASAYSGQFTLIDRYEYFRDAFPNVLSSHVPLWILAALGLVAACGRRATRRVGVLSTVFLVFSFLAAAAAGVFEGHYFILMLPAVALAIGAWAASGHRYWLLLCVAAACLYSVVAERKYLFSMTPYEFARDTWGNNPFPEAVKIADYIRAHSAPDARIAVLGSEAEIYFYAHRKAATGYLFTYNLMDSNQWAGPLQREMIAEIEAARPEFIVFVGVHSSWMDDPDSTRTIFNWESAYTAAHYTKVGVVDIPAAGDSKFVWGNESAEYKPVNPDYLIVCRRRDANDQLIP